MKRNIILIGMPGTGKSSTGKILAKMAGMAFADSDAIIEKSEGLTVAEIFAKYGEPRFREIESSVLAELSLRRGTVISCGGGAVLSEQSMTLLKKSGFVVWLKAPPEKIFSRVSADNTRPLINKEGGAAAIEKTLKIREPLYGKYADFNIDSDVLTPNAAAEEILLRFGQ